MGTFRNLITASIGAVLLIVGLRTGAQGQVGGGNVPSFGGELRSMTRFRGSVVCVGCSLDEARKAQADSGHLYELKYNHGQAVMNVKWVDDASRWETIVGLSHRLWVRAADELFQQLTAEKNLFKEMEITGLLRSDMVLDMASVTVRE